MRVRSALWLVALVVGLCPMGCMSQQTSVKHGPTIVFQVAPKPGDRWPASAAGRAATLKKVQEVLQKRVVSITGVSEPSITTQAPDKIVVELPGVTDLPAATKQLTAIGSLEFYYLKNVLTSLNPHAKWKLQPASQTGKNYIFSRTDGKYWLDSGKSADMAKIMTQVVGVPANKPVLTGADLLPNAKAALRPSGNQPVIEIQFNERGAKAFSDFTASHVGEIVAIFYDGRLVTAPTVRERIMDGRAIISGFSSLKQATEVATLLNSGALPVHLKLFDVRK